MNPRTPPNDYEAERSAIHHTLTKGKIPEPLENLQPTDFYQPHHETIWTIIRWLTTQKRPTDANSVLARLTETGNQNIIGKLPDLINGPLNGDPQNLALILTDRASRRHTITAIERATQRCYESEDPAEEIVRKTELELSQRPTHDTDHLETLTTHDEFLGQHIPQPDWVIPGLLARGDRLILTGEEGFGKSTLLRQLATCTAAGIQPFTGNTIPPMTVLAIDVENPLWIMQKRYTELRQAINAHGHNIQPTRFWIDRRPEGINLGEPRDRRWLQKRIIATNPDLIVIGPAYKLHHAGDNTKDETIARTVTGVLDELRGNAALILEHHSGNETPGLTRPIRPFGSSLWRRWPEFGYGIRPAKTPPDMTAQEAADRRIAELVSWRGARDEREWPRHLESGGTGLPWITYTMRPRLVS